jgi:hypothetical protein
MWLGNSVTTWASMAFKYSCFISYCHGQRDILSGFIDQFANALSSELELRMDQEVYVDKSRLKPGYIYDEALARAICESVCMIVVCSPRYLRHAYCRREYEAMRQLEERRRALLGEAAHGRGFIIPVILREDAALMAYIGDRAHYCDLSRFGLRTRKLVESRAFREAIETIAQVIYEQYRSFETLPVDPCASCREFRLPDAPISPYRPAFVNE